MAGVKLGNLCRQLNGATAMEASCLARTRRRRSRLELEAVAVEQAAVGKRGEHGEVEFRDSPRYPWEFEAAYESRREAKEHGWVVIPPVQKAQKLGLEGRP